VSVYPQTYFQCCLKAHPKRCSPAQRPRTMTSMSQYSIFEFPRNQIALLHLRFSSSSPGYESGPSAPAVSIAATSSGMSGPTQGVSGRTLHSRQKCKPSLSIPRYSFSLSSLFVVVTITAPFARTQSCITCAGVACRRAAGPARALVTGPFGYWVIGLATMEKRGEVNKRAGERNRGADVRQRTICLDYNAALLRKPEQLSVFRVVIGVEVYLRVNTIKE